MRVLQKLMTAANRLGDRFKPVFGQFSLAIVLCSSVYLSLETNLSFQTLDKGVPVSLIGYLLPAALVSDSLTFQLLKVVFWISAACWLSVPFLRFGSDRFLRWFIPVASWLTYVTYTVIASIYWENLPFYLHKFVLPSWLLLIHALWYHFYKKEIIVATRQRSFWTAKVYPRWTYSLSVWVIAIFYTMSGLSKLGATLDWGDGLSLQLWTFMYADHNSPFAKLIVADRIWAKCFQSGVLSLECASFLAAFDARAKTIVGLGLLFFHAAVDMTFHIDFRPNMVLLVLYFMPIFEVVVRADSKQEMPNSHVGV